ncbi:MAG: hypothetical protein ACTSU2_06245 [Promethearchaeota archaeon]
MPHYSQYPGACGLTSLLMSLKPDSRGFRELFEKIWDKISHYFRQTRDSMGAIRRVESYNWQRVEEWLLFQVAINPELQRLMAEGFGDYFWDVLLPVLKNRVGVRENQFEFNILMKNENGMRISKVGVKGTKNEGGQEGHDGQEGQEGQEEHDGQEGGNSNNTDITLGTSKLEDENLLALGSELKENDKMPIESHKIKIKIKMQISNTVEEGPNANEEDIEENNNTGKYGESSSDENLSVDITDEDIMRFYNEGIKHYGYLFNRRRLMRRVNVWKMDFELELIAYIFGMRFIPWKQSNDGTGAVFFNRKDLDEISKELSKLKDASMEMKTKSGGSNEGHPKPSINIAAEGFQKLKFIEEYVKSENPVLCCATVHWLAIKDVLISENNRVLIKYHDPSGGHESVRLLNGFSESDRFYVFKYDPELYKRNKKIIENIIEKSIY